MASVLAGSSKDDSQPFSIDFSIRHDSIPIVSYADVLRGDPSVLNRLFNKKVIIGAPRSNSATAYDAPGPHHIRSLAAGACGQSILQGVI